MIENPIMAPPPMVSVIMNCFNGEKYLFEALDSVHAQTYQDWEIIFWDNASTDRTQQIIKDFNSEKIKYFRADKNTDLGLARNLAITKASGKYLAFLDCDDMYLPGKLYHQVAFMEEKKYSFSYGSAIIIDDLGKEVRKYKVRNKSGFLLPDLLRKYEINMQTVMVEKGLLEEHGLVFDTNLKYSPDYDLFMQLAALTNCGVIKDYLVKYRVGLPGSLSKKTLHLVAHESRTTLDKLVKRYPQTVERFEKPLNFAYTKLAYYQAISFINENNYRDAQKILWPIITDSPKYLVLYIMIFCKFPRNFLLKILRR